MRTGTFEREWEEEDKRLPLGAFPSHFPALGERWWGWEKGPMNTYEGGETPRLSDVRGKELGLPPKAGAPGPRYSG